MTLEEGLMMALSNLLSGVQGHDTGVDDIWGDAFMPLSTSRRVRWLVTPKLIKGKENGGICYLRFTPNRWWWEGECSAEHLHEWRNTRLELARKEFYGIN